MSFVLDTNILLRLAQPKSSQYSEAKNAVDKLIADDVALYVLLQNVSEFWNVCTRPTENNGLGFSIEQTDTELTSIETIFLVLPDNEDVYTEWRKLVVTHSVSGVRVHDAKIVAAMKAHDISNLLTFNTQDFKRYADIIAIQPKDIP